MTPSPEQVKDLCKKKSTAPWRNSLYGSRDRCRNPNNKRYKNYGGRGIKCLLSHQDVAFLWYRDMASKMKDATLDRVDNDGDYVLSNCRFIERVKNSSRINGDLKSCRRGHDSFVVKKNGKRECSECSRAWMRSRYVSGTRPNALRERRTK